MKCLLFDLSIVKLTNNHFGDFSIYLYKIDTRITFNIHFIFANQYTSHVVNFHAIGITDYIDLSVAVSYTHLDQSRYWDDKFYLWPIPQSERNKDPNLTQNPGYNE